MIIGVDKKRISLSLKPSYFSQDELEGAAIEESGDDGNAGASSPFGAINKAMMDDDDEGAGGDVEMRPTVESSSDEDDEDDAMEIDVTATTQLFQRYERLERGNGSPSAPPAVLTLGDGFKWYGLDEPKESDNYEVDSSDSEAESDREHQTHRKKRKRKEIEQDLTADLHTKVPESNADFERVLLGSPNSSYVWIQYMSFQLQLAEIEKAQDIGRRAVRTINFREEQERLNVWIALLNLENIYGTGDSLEALFKEAARANDSKTIHLRLASILSHSGKREKAIEQYQRTCKKFGASSKVWTSFAEFYLSHNSFEEARRLLPRSFQSLEKRKRGSIPNSITKLF
jgi:rRNA biogenesis protein RRP5